ncbi:hypothetical protein HanXRQr2_Chr12g0555531 [Helianthus annuus]|uniref:Uncharacterized protein n=1 Tax=Helianthus annuus TaxID=4232 RepID=A0A9K3HIW1_HELAN|nr:hypothetical protein HanXRQr2_Chr12g0555531 [Helianthus annuus]KAJ0506345.1 hypothetical protein HanHA89_Chr12g0480911 [Helianthus annuus]KAJ0679262.1 hypothetical protein HanOQP8_Chr12g0457391 [Helianthus annuus]KAJ0863852.1 hypothetical protein HanPSC8_Chr12g0534841 [Helianthus annuus]
MEMVVDGRRGGGHSVLRRWVTTAVAMFSAAARVQFQPRYVVTCCFGRLK